ncbi:hypothetical protein V2J09_005098 [Rumex salicifolius]
MTDKEQRVNELVELASITRLSGVLFELTKSLYITQASDVGERLASFNFEKYLTTLDRSCSATNSLINTLYVGRSKTHNYDPTASSPSKALMLKTTFPCRLVLQV